MSTTTRIADVLTFVTMAGLTLASAAALATYTPAPLIEAEAVTVLPTVVVTGKSAAVAVHRLPTVFVTAKRIDNSERVAAANCLPSVSAVC